eukprot:gene4857-883_t
MEEEPAVKVVVRVRPSKNPAVWTEGTQVVLKNPYCIVSPGEEPSKLDKNRRSHLTRRENSSFSFTFDGCYSTCSDDEQQAQVYEEMGRPILRAALEGYNASVIAYGQTGSGKSYTIMGDPGRRWNQTRGIIPRLCEDLFNNITNNMERTAVEVNVTYIEIYNNQVYCLLDGSQKDIRRVREHPKTGPYVEGITKVRVKSKQEIEALIDEGNRARKVSETEHNQHSSRSHAIFALQVVQRRTARDDLIEDSIVLESRISLVDLAGSERLKRSKAFHDRKDHTKAAMGMSQPGPSSYAHRIAEASHINKILVSTIESFPAASLAQVICTLSGGDPKDPTTPRGTPGTPGRGSKFSNHVPYRNSVLTWVRPYPPWLLLKESLGGSSRTVMFATISPLLGDFDESLSTLRYADRLKNIENKPIQNMQVDTSEHSLMIERLRDQVQTLRVERESLQERNTEQEDEIKNLQQHIDLLDKTIEDLQNEEAQENSRALQTSREEFEASPDSATSDIQEVAPLHIPARPVDKQTSAPPYQPPRSSHGAPTAVQAAIQDLKTPLKTVSQGTVWDRPPASCHTGMTSPLSQDAGDTEWSLLSPVQNDTEAPRGWDSEWVQPINDVRDTALEKPKNFGVQQKAFMIPPQNSPPKTGPPQPGPAPGPVNQLPDSNVAGPDVQSSFTVPVPSEVNVPCHPHILKYNLVTPDMVEEYYCDLCMGHAYVSDETVRPGPHLVPHSTNLSGPDPNLPDRHGVGATSTQMNPTDQFPLAQPLEESPPAESACPPSYCYYPAQKGDSAEQSLPHAQNNQGKHMSGQLQYHYRSYSQPYPHQKPQQQSHQQVNLQPPSQPHFVDAESHQKVAPHTQDQSHVQLQEQPQYSQHLLPHPDNHAYVQYPTSNQTQAHVQLPIQTYPYKEELPCVENQTHQAQPHPQARQDQQQGNVCTGPQLSSTGPNHPSNGTSLDQENSEAVQPTRSAQSGEHVEHYGRKQHSVPQQSKSGLDHHPLQQSSHPPPITPCTLPSQTPCTVPPHTAQSAAADQQDTGAPQTISSNTASNPPAAPVNSGPEVPQPQQVSANSTVQPPPVPPKWDPQAAAPFQAFPHRPPTTGERNPPYYVPPADMSGSGPEYFHAFSAAKKVPIDGVRQLPDRQTAYGNVAVQNQVLPAETPKTNGQQYNTNGVVPSMASGSGPDAFPKAEVSRDGSDKDSSDLNQHFTVAPHPGFSEVMSDLESQASSLQSGDPDPARHLAVVDDDLRSSPPSPDYLQCNESTTHTPASAHQVEQVKAPEFISPPPQPRNGVPVVPTSPSQSQFSITVPQHACTPPPIQAANLQHRTPPVVEPNQPQQLPGQRTPSYHTVDAQRQSHGALSGGGAVSPTGDQGTQKASIVPPICGFTGSTNLHNKNAEVAQQLGNITAPSPRPQLPQTPAKTKGSNAAPPRGLPPKPFPPQQPTRHREPRPRDPSENRSVHSASVPRTPLRDIQAGKAASPLPGGCPKVAAYNPKGTGSSGQSPGNAGSSNVFVSPWSSKNVTVFSQVVEPDSVHIKDDNNLMECSFNGPTAISGCQRPMAMV